jgi:hypothetical protein
MKQNRNKAYSSKSNVIIRHRTVDDVYSINHESILTSCSIDMHMNDRVSDTSIRGLHVDIDRSDKISSPVSFGARSSKSDHLEPGSCASPGESAGEHISKCCIGPKPTSMLHQPGFLSDDEPEIDLGKPPVCQRQPVKVVYNFRSLPHLDLGHKLAVVMPLNDRQRCHKMPRHKCQASTPTSIHKVINSEISTPVLLNLQDYKKLGRLQHGVKPQSSLHRATPESDKCEPRPAEDGEMQQDRDHIRKVHFAPNSVLMYYDS